MPTKRSCGSNLHRLEGAWRVDQWRRRPVRGDPLRRGRRAAGLDPGRHRVAVLAGRSSGCRPGALATASTFGVRPYLVRVLARLTSSPNSRSSMSSANASPSRSRASPVNEAKRYGKVCLWLGAQRASSHSRSIDLRPGPSGRDRPACSCGVTGRDRRRSRSCAAIAPKDGFRDLELTPVTGCQHMPAIPPSGELDRRNRSKLGDRRPATLVDRDTVTDSAGWRSWRCSVRLCCSARPAPRRSSGPTRRAHSASARSGSCSGR